MPRRRQPADTLDEAESDNCSHGPLVEIEGIRTCPVCDLELYFDDSDDLEPEA
jgi:hypothetical protein